MATHLHLASSPALASSREALPITVVLADDHKVVRRNLRLLLDGEADVVVVAEAEDMTSAVRHVADDAPRVLVLDIRLPNGSSLETVRRLRERSPQTEVIVLTMEESPSFARQALDAGAVGFVLKDRADSELVTAIRRAARGDEYVSSRVATALEGLRGAIEGDELSPRETEVLRLIALGHTSAEIAAKLHLSRRTVETHRARIYRKLGLTTRAQLVQFALRRHLLSA